MNSAARPSEEKEAIDPTDNLLALAAAAEAAVVALLDRDEQVRLDAESLDEDYDSDAAHRGILDVEKVWGLPRARQPQFSYGYGLLGGEDEAREWGPVKYGAYVVAMEQAVEWAREDYADALPRHIHVEWARDFQSHAGF